jgi:hypothetical protein
VATLIRVRDTLRVYLRVPADTIYKTVQVEIPKPVIEKKKGFFERLGNSLLWMTLASIGALVFVFLFYVKSKIFNK